MADETVRAAKIAAVGGIAVAVIGLTGVLGAAWMAQNQASSTSTQPTNEQVIDCTDERQQAIDLWRLHPEITIPYQGAGEQACQLNEVIAQAVNAAPATP